MKTGHGTPFDTRTDYFKTELVHAFSSASGHKTVEERKKKIVNYNIVEC